MSTRRTGNNRYYRGAESDHFRAGRFFNPEGEAPRGLADLLRWRMSRGRKAWPASWPSPFQPAKPADRLDGPALRVTMVGHASLLVQTCGINVLTDPVWSDRVSPLSFAGPKRVNAPGISFDDLPPIDLVLVSHNHYDHLDCATLARIDRACRPAMITLLGNDGIVAAAAPGSTVTAHDWGERIDITDSIAVHVEPAHHWSARGTRDRRMALWGGFVIETPAGRILFAGDTGFHGGRHYRALADKHGGFRLAILPIGAYEPRWFMEAQHQNPEEAVDGMLLANASFAAGCHWGTFPLTDEAIDEPSRRLDAALAERGIDSHRFRAMRPGEVWDVPPA
ncbi:MBL fold metallo-hydrolase [Mesorhizobium sp. ZMM04-5]|uniref:MBL fold metallo-hydrolase n=1 Tax=Mesorhizobium marinum TaxID=3228790 RepID=A0ABV3QY10_9HYPH